MTTEPRLLKYKGDKPSKHNQNKRIRKSAKQLDGTIARNLDKYGKNNYQRILDPEGGAVTGDRETIGGLLNQFPARYFSKTPQDDKYAFINNYVASGKPLGEIAAPDDLIDYAMKKDQEIERVKYEEWLLNMFGKASSPVTYAALKKTHPEIWKARADWIHLTSRIQAYLAVLKMKPITEWTKDDYQLKYMLDKGLIDIPKNGVHHPEAYQTVEFKKGIFNPRRFMLGPNTGTEAAPSGLDTWFKLPSVDVKNRNLNAPWLARFMHEEKPDGSQFPFGLVGQLDGEGGGGTGTTGQVQSTS